MLESGLPATLTFNKPGSQTYTCARDPFMIGEVVVTGAEVKGARAMVAGSPAADMPGVAAAPGHRVGSLVRITCRDIGPEGLDILGFQNILPWRHLALAIGHRIDEPGVRIAGELPQVDPPLGIAHPGAMAGLAILGKKRRSLRHKFWR